MFYENSVGRPSKVTWAVILKLADSLQHNRTIAEACRFAGISRQTYYNHLNNNDVFATQMEVAMSSRDKVSFIF